ncbi:MAG: FkbM family methyltransferase [Bacteroidota bacterium]
MLLKTSRRILNFYKRWQNARKIGIHFSGLSHFTLPRQIIINHKTIKPQLYQDASTTSAFIEIFLNDCYGLFYFKKQIDNIVSVVDIGANQGLFVLFARNVFPNATIHAYEPNELVIDSLSKHANEATARYFNEAVGLTNSKITLNNGVDTLHGKTYISEEGNITQISIKECLQRMNGKIDILKLDCEGAEWEILEDFESLQSVQAITLEYHMDDEHLAIHQNDHSSILKLLQRNNFTIVHQSFDGPTWGVVWATRH